MVVDEPPIAVHPLREGIGDSFQRHVLGLEVPIWGAVPVLQIEVTLVVDGLGVHVQGPAGDCPVAPRLSQFCVHQG